MNRAYTVSLLEGFRNAGYAIDAELEKTYTKYIKEDRKVADFTLAAQESGMIEAVCVAFHKAGKKVVVILRDSNSHEKV